MSTRKQNARYKKDVEKEEKKLKGCSYDSVSTLSLDLPQPPKFDDVIGKTHKMGPRCRVTKIREQRKSEKKTKKCREKKKEKMKAYDEKVHRDAEKVEKYADDVAKVASNCLHKAQASKCKLTELEETEEALRCSIDRKVKAMECAVHLIDNLRKRKAKMEKKIDCETQFVCDLETKIDAQQTELKLISLPQSKLRKQLMRDNGALVKTSCFAVAWRRKAEDLHCFSRSVRNQLQCDSSLQDQNARQLLRHYRICKTVHSPSSSSSSSSSCYSSGEVQFRSISGFQSRQRID